MNNFMKNTLEKIINFAVQVADPEQIILFGSMAEGKATAFSDIDLLVVTENTNLKRFIREKMQNFSRELSVKTDIFIYSKSELEKDRQLPHSFSAYALTFGKIVYEKIL